MVFPDSAGWLGNSISILRRLLCSLLHISFLSTFGLVNSYRLDLDSSIFIRLRVVLVENFHSALVFLIVLVFANGEQMY